MTDTSWKISRLECSISLVGFPLTEGIRLSVGPYKVFFL